MSSSKLCNKLKKDYIEEASEKIGLSINDARKLSKLELCMRLGHIKPPAIEKKKRCSSHKLKNNAQRYSRTDLELYALTRGISLKEIRSMKYDELCAHLGLSSEEAIISPKNVQTEKVNCIDRAIKPLKDYQKRVVEHFAKHHGLLVWHKMGSGKTLTAITISQCYLDSHPTHRVIVIAPAGLINNFKNEMQDCYGAVRHPNQYSFYSIQKFVSESKKKNINCRNALIIVDEAHNLRAIPRISGIKPKGINTKHVLDCTNKAHKVVLLTATPIYNSLNDLVPLYNMIRDVNRHPEIKKFDESNIQKMRCLVSFHEFLQNDRNFPKAIYEDVLIEMSKSYEKRYKKLVKSIKEGGESGLPSIFKALYGEKDLAVFLNAVRRGTNNLFTTVSDNAKLNWILDKINSIPSDERVVIYSGFLSAGMDLIIKKIKDKTFAIINGDTKPSERHKIVKDYNDGKIQLLFISRAGGEGLSLMETRHVILLEPSWNDSSEAQIIARAIRYKSHDALPVSERNVRIYKLYHILAKDKNLLTKKIPEYLRDFKKDPDTKMPLNPYENSCDLYLKVYMTKKQITLDKFNRILQNLSIEKNVCL